MHVVNNIKLDVSSLTNLYKPCKYGRTIIFSFLVILIFIIGAEGDEVLLRVEKVSICGSDISLYTWNEMARVIATVPFIPGHDTLLFLETIQ